jgi:hypothetical protein
MKHYLLTDYSGGDLLPTFSTLGHYPLTFAFISSSCRQFFYIKYERIYSTKAKIFRAKYSRMMEEGFYRNKPADSLSL